MNDAKYLKLCNLYDELHDSIVNEMNYHGYGFPCVTDSYFNGKMPTIEDFDKVLVEFVDYVLDKASADKIDYDVWNKKSMKNNLVSLLKKWISEDCNTLECGGVVPICAILALYLIYGEVVDCDIPFAPDSYYAEQYHSEDNRLRFRAYSIPEDQEFGYDYGIYDEA